MTLRSACACALRCFTGYSNSGSILANRASVCASSRSSFLRLSPISRTLRAFATITACPNSLSKRLIQGECVPISSAIRQRGISPKTSRNAFAFVRTLRSSRIWPGSSSTQYQLLRSPRSNPTVNFGCEIFLLGFAATVLIFFIAGLLFICALSTSITWERTASRRRPAFSSHLLATADAGWELSFRPKSRVKPHVIHGGVHTRRAIVVNFVATQFSSYFYDLTSQRRQCFRVSTKLLSRRAKRYCHILRELRIRSSQFPLHPRIKYHAWVFVPAFYSSQPRLVEYGSYLREFLGWQGRILGAEVLPCSELSGLTFGGAV